MLLVSFHGSDPAHQNLFAYETPSGENINKSVLEVPAGLTLSELRAITPCGGQLFIANGAKSESQVLCYGMPGSTGACPFVSVVIGPVLSKSQGHFKTCIAHPFGIAFDGPERCFVTNQDTNTVALVTVLHNQGSLGKGSQSQYLNDHFPGPDFLDGTFVASQQGDLHDVSVKAPDVPATNGGLGVSPDTPGAKPQNSVRDVAVSNGVLYVCDEVGKTVNSYSLADGSFLGPSNQLPSSPTHFALSGNGLYVTAGASLWWAPIPAGGGGGLTLQNVSITVPSGNTIGGISFDAGTVYVPFQTGKGGKNPGGSIMTFQVDPDTPREFSDPATFHDGLSDTPEFVLFVTG